MTKAPFDPWDWLGVCCGGFNKAVDMDILSVLEALPNNEESEVDQLDPAYKQLICTLLCNTDDFDFDGDPSNIRFVGGHTFNSIVDVIDAFDTYYRRRWGEPCERN